MIELPQIADGEDKTSAFKNRIRKNYRHIRKWAKKSNTDCFRIYDRDIKEYPLAIEFYAGFFCVHYFSYDRATDEPPEDLKREVEDVLFSIFGCVPNQIYWRTRMKRSRLEQYEKRAEEKTFFIVHEYGVKFKVNLVDYLDTGLFLDHRETRQKVALLSKGKWLLNLFSYTCSFSVVAAVNGAAYTKSVDLSNTYCDWGRENFVLNDCSLKTNEVIRADCLTFLKEERQSIHSYDVIVIDPPTISRSKKMDQIFTVEFDSIDLILQSLMLLKEEGVLFFSTNSRKFSLDASAFQNYYIREITKETIPQDFHNQKIHRCWEIRKKPAIYR